MPAAFILVRTCSAKSTVIRPLRPARASLQRLLRFVDLLQETRTIPVIFGIVADPIGSGFVASFNRPGSNATGFAVAEPTQAGKWVELLKEIAPQVTRVAVLFNPAMATFAEFWLKPFRAAAPSFAMEVILAPVRDTSELEHRLCRTGTRTKQWPFGDARRLHDHLPR
jgi:hypothetical protein